MTPSSRTPEGEPNLCPICESKVRIEPSRPPGDVPCPNCGHLLWFSGREPASGIFVVRFTDSVDRNCQQIEELSQKLHAMVTQAKHINLRLNFRDVRLMSTAMIKKLVALNKTCKEKRVKLTFCEVSPNVMEVFKITKLNKLFDIQ